MQPTRPNERLAALVLLLVLAASASSAGDWSRFRGPNGSGLSAESGLPLEFGPGKNEVWSLEVPFGRSSPALTDDTVFLTAIDQDRLVTLAVDAQTGEKRWSRSIDRGHTASLHSATDSATPSPVTDGENVYALFHEAGLVSYDKDGNRRWTMELGPFRNYYGIASSPILAGGRLYVVCDQAGGSFVMAVDSASGKPAWRTERPKRAEAYATPLLYPESDPKLLLVAGSRWVDAYDLASGELVWSLGGVGSGPVASPVLVGNRLYVAAIDHAESGWPEFPKLLAEHDADDDGELTPSEVAETWMKNHFPWLDTDASGELSQKDWDVMAAELDHDEWGVFAVDLAAEGAKLGWNYRQNVPYIPSPIVTSDVFYMIKDGIVTSLDPKSGELIKRGRLGDGSPKVYASPVAADGRLYVATLEGTVAVLRGEGEWEVVAENDLGEEIWATPAIAEGDLFVRTRERLYRFGLEEEKAPTTGGSSP